MDDTQHVIYHSTVQSALIPTEKNPQLAFSKGENDPCKPARQVLNICDTESAEYGTLLFQPLQSDELIRHTFLTTPTEDRQCFHTHIIRYIQEIDNIRDEA